MELPSLDVNCDACAALCCVAFSFVDGQGFGADKEADAPCPNLTRHRCAIYGARAQAGWSACDHYGCDGAGPYVTGALFDGASWAEDDQLRRDMGQAMRDIRPIFEALALLKAAEETLPLTALQRAEVSRARAAVWPEGGWTRDALTEADPRGLLDATRQVLRGFRDAVTSG